MSNKLSALKLISACRKSLAKNEYNLRTISGVQMSHSDVETALLYAETVSAYGRYTGHLVKPRGAVAEVLGKFNLEEEG